MSYEWFRWLWDKTMSQTKSQDFGGFLPIKSEPKVQLTKIWSHLIDLTELFHIKPFPKVLDRLVSLLTDHVYPYLILYK